MLMTPMLVQYLVGLCCLRNNPDAVDVTVGDFVVDTAAKKSRDVDVTVTLKEEDGSVSAFKAYEVKREGEPLDVVTVEQLCMKLRDMPKVTHPAIVSSSNYTDGAINKAITHRVALYVMKSWNLPISSQISTLFIANSDTHFQATLLYWVDARCHFLTPTAATQNSSLDNDAPIFTAKGKVHKRFPNLARLKDDLLMRSTAILYVLEPAQTILGTFPLYSIQSGGEFDIGPAWPHTHTIQLTDDKVFLMVNGALHAIHSVTINGRLQWRSTKRTPHFYMMEGVPDGKVFAGATIADFGSDDGKMCAFILSPESSGDIGVHLFRLSEKHRHIIRGLKIPLRTVG
jgi:hypothetical protein